MIIPSRLVLVSLCLALLTACNSNKQPSSASPSLVKSDSGSVSPGSSSKGIGRFTNVPLTHPLDSEMIATGQATYGSKCNACHKLTDEKLVGPGWKGVTDRRSPEWIMNFITNTQVMLDKDLTAQSEIVSCLVRMPNQDLTDAQARAMLELMRKIDGKN